MMGGVKAYATVKSGRCWPFLLLFLTLLPTIPPSTAASPGTAAAMASPRWVTVDDTSGSIEYSGPWTLDSGSNWRQGNFGGPYLNSLHSMKGGKGSFSYTFDGTSGTIYGTNNIKTSTAGVQDPIWTCQVDSTTITLPVAFPYTENNWVLCTWDNLSAGKHTITITATSVSQAFLFDRFQYIPSPSAAVTNADILVLRDDSSLQYGSGWVNLGTIGKMAPNGGAVVTFPFYGTGISWWGTAPTELPHGPTTAEYTIDGGSPVTVTLPGIAISNTQYFQQIFKASSLSLGQHTLQVTSKGTTSLTPLVLSSLIIEGGSVQEPAATTPDVPAPVNDPSTTSVTGSGSSTSTATTTTGSSTSQTNTTSANANKSASNTSNIVTPTGSTGTAQNVAPTSESTPGSESAIENGNKHSSPIGAIVGGVIGGLIVLLLLIFAFLCFRRKRRKRELHKLGLEAQPFTRGQSPDRTYSTSTSVGTQGGDAATTTQLGVGAYSAMSQTQNSSGYVSKYGARTPTTSRFGVQGESYSSTRGTGYSNHGSNPYSISNQSEMSSSAPSSAGSSAALLSFPSLSGNSAISASKHLEHSQYSSIPASPESAGAIVPPRVINHQDSGYRLPRPQIVIPVRAEVIEYPPEYTAS